MGIGFNVLANTNVSCTGVVAASDCFAIVISTDLAGRLISVGSAGEWITGSTGIDENGKGIHWLEFIILGTDTRKIAQRTSYLLDTEPPLAKVSSVIAADTFPDGHAGVLAVLGELQALILTGNIGIVKRSFPIM